MFYKIKPAFLKLSSLVLLSVFLLNLFNKSFNVHSHQLGNGKIIIHAHPYDKQNDKNPIKSHQHSSIEFLLLGSASYFLISQFEFEFNHQINITKQKIQSFIPIQFKNSIQVKLNKSPPYLINI